MFEACRRDRVSMSQLEARARKGATHRLLALDLRLCHLELALLLLEALRHLLDVGPPTRSNDGLEADDALLRLGEVGARARLAVDELLRRRAGHAPSLRGIVAQLVSEREQQPLGLLEPRRQVRHDVVLADLDLTLLHLVRAFRLRRRLALGLGLGLAHPQVDALEVAPLGRLANAEAAQLALVSPEARLARLGERLELVERARLVRLLGAQLVRLGLELVARGAKAREARLMSREACLQVGDLLRCLTLRAPSSTATSAHSL